MANQEWQERKREREHVAEMPIHISRREHDRARSVLIDTHTTIIVPAATRARCNGSDNEMPYKVKEEEKQIDIDK